MKTQEMMIELVDDIHTTVVATVDENGNPHTSVIDMMMTRDEKLYFLTAKGKSFYSRIKMNPNISLSGVKGEDTMSSISISVRGKVRDIGDNLLDTLFTLNPYMYDIYPSQASRQALSVFEIYEGRLEYFDLSKKGIERYSCNFGTNQVVKYPYFINKACIGCGDCKTVCPRSCIKEGSPFYIIQENCLHCGNCYNNCRYEGVTRSI